MTYTDKQYIAVAEWLGVEDQLDRNHHGIIIKETGGVEIGDWLLSPEGRVAIEDRFIETEFDIGAFKNYKGEYEVHVNGDDAPPEKEFICAVGHTPAEAWLAAAISEVEG